MQKGFTVVELIIVIGIIVMVSTLSLASLPQLSSQVRINEAVEDILRAIREARHNSIAIREFSPGSDIFPSYGLYFDIDSPQKFIMYADCKINDNGDQILDDRDNFTFNPDSINCDGGNGWVKDITLDPKVSITAIRSITTGDPVEETKAYVEYIRPEPSIWISDSDGNVLPLGKIEIELTSITNAFTKTVLIWTTGNVEVK
jgi:prepilin-type N-terminal cleavage/methylation domain-containing protein